MSRQYDKTVLIGDFNLTIENKSLKNFMTTFDLETFNKETNLFSVFKSNLHNLILTNKKEFFKNTNVIEVGISDHHNLIVTALKVYY